MTENKTVVTSVVGDRVTVDTAGMLRVGGVALCRVVEKNGVLYIEIKDRMRLRIEARGRRFVYATVSSLMDALLDISD